MDHYFSQKPAVSHAEKLIELDFHKRSLQFYTAAGVFSRERVDYGSLVLLKALPPVQGRVLDLGCGYGAVGITLASLYPDAQVTMVDINERAVQLAQRNIALNNVTNACALISDGFANLEGKFDVIVSNPPIRAGKKTIYPWFHTSHERLATQGWLAVVVQRKQGAKSVRVELERVFSNCSVLDKSGGYWVLMSIKREVVG